MRRGAWSACAGAGCLPAMREAPCLVRSSRWAGLAHDGSLPSRFRHQHACADGGAVRGHAVLCAGAARARARVASRVLQVGHGGRSQRRTEDCTPPAAEMGPNCLGSPVGR
jgi:hypothetical protein